MMFLFRINSPRIKDRTYVIDLHQQQSKETVSVLLFIDRNTIVCFDSYRTEHISHKLLNKIKSKSITHKAFRVQEDNSFLCDLHCIDGRKSFVKSYPFTFSYQI